VMGGACWGPGVPTAFSTNPTSQPTSHQAPAEGAGGTYWLGVQNPGSQRLHADQDGGRVS